MRRIRTLLATNDAQALNVEEMRKEFQIYTPGEVALLAGVTTQQLTIWRARAQGPEHIRLGKRVFYTHDAIHTWIAQSHMLPDPTKPPKFTPEGKPYAHIPQRTRS